MGINENILDIINLYEQGKSLNFIASKYGTYGAKIKQLLIDNGIKTRTHAEQNKITNQARAKKVDHSYFDKIDSLQKAWLLGFLASDGTVAKDRNHIKISLSSIDKKILEDIKKEIKSERPILNYETNQGFNISELIWTSENHKCQLAKYNIVPNKTYKGIKLPCFSQEYQLAFFLGYFDGDGTFKNDGSTCRIQICSYKPDILNNFNQLFKDIFNTKDKQPYLENHKKSIYTITYSTKEAILIMDYIYNLMITNNCFFLQRKYNKYQEWKIQNNRI